jgi:hypothetical protein
LNLKRSADGGCTPTVDGCRVLFRPHFADVASVAACVIAVFIEKEINLQRHTMFCNAQPQCSRPQFQPLSPIKHLNPFAILNRNLLYTSSLRNGRCSRRFWCGEGKCGRISSQSNPAQTSLTCFVDGHDPFSELFGPNRNPRKEGESVCTASSSRYMAP